MSLKKVFPLLALLLATTVIKAQNLQTITLKIDSLSNLGLPKSALLEVDTLDQLGRKTHNAPMQVGAAIYRMVLQSYIEENALAAIIVRLKADVDQAEYPAKPVLQSVLAAMYYGYYQQHRWQFGQRTRLQTPGEDFTKWDLQTMIDEASRRYRLSLADAAREQNTPVSVLEGVLQGDEETRVLRPTLYDLLLHRALDFYLSEEASLPRPRLPFLLNDPNFFGDSKTFVSLSVKTSDTTSTYYQGLKYLQQGTAFHISKGDAEALADLDLKRLNFLHAKARYTGSDSLYLNALDHIAEQFAGKPVSAEVWEFKASFYQQQSNYKEAVQWLNKAITGFPDSFGGKNAAVMLADITQKHLSTAVESHNTPGKPILGLITYRNTQKATVSIYRITERTFGNNSAGNNTLTPTAINNIVSNMTPLQVIRLNMPDVGDYKVHSAEFKIDALEPGNYLTVVKDSVITTEDMINYSNFKVSILSYNSRQLKDKSYEMRVLNRETGQPMKGVLVHIFEYDKGESNTGLTDDAGYFHYAIKMNRLDIALTFGSDTLTDKNKYVYDEYRNVNDVVAHNIIFTDRQIYRPGQTIYFKTLAMETSEGKNKLQTGTSLDIALKGSNGKVISSIELKTNEFGTASGSFVIPLNVAHGRAFLSANDNGGVNVDIEEYKRPTFAVSFDPVKESYKYNDSVTVKGHVKAFAGYGLSQARVAYHIVRSVMAYPMYKYYEGNFRTLSSDEIKTDTILTDSQGDFTLKFKAEIAPGQITGVRNYSYNISASATDATGETHSDQSYVMVGNNNIQISAGIPEKMFTTDSMRIPADITNLNDQPIKGTMFVQVYALKNPEHLFKSREWQVPDQWLMAENIFHKAFPDYAYRKEDETDSFPVLKRLAETSLTVNDSTHSFIDLNILRKQPTGNYKVVISARNEKGDTVTAIRFIELNGKGLRTARMNDWLLPASVVIKPGAHADFRVGVNDKCYVLAELYQGDKIISSQWVSTGREPKLVSLPIPADAGNNYNAQFLMVYKNRMYARYEHINIQQNDKLDVSFLTYRNKLQPGSKEQWTLQVKGAGKTGAEMVASLYDASLDAVTAPQNWRDMAAMGDNYRQYFTWNSYNFTGRTNSSPLNYHYKNYAFISRGYETLDLMGYSYYGNYNSGYYGYQRKMQQLNTERLRNSDLIKNGKDVTGKVTDSKGDALPGVSVSIKGTTMATVTDKNGNFKMRAPVAGTLLFNFIGFAAREAAIPLSGPMSVKLQEGGGDLNEVVVIGYGSQKKVSLTGSIGSVTARQIEAQPGAKFSKDGLVRTVRELQQLGNFDEEKVSGRPGTSEGTIQIRGSSSIEPGKEPLWVVDGVIAGSTPKDLNPDQIESINILKGSEATALYGARGANGVITITTKRGALAALAQQPVVRKNFNETAFFYPQLRTDEKGDILIEFTMPEALTKWRFKAFAHTQDLKTGYLESEVVTQKQLSITANTPRFLREGDTLTISARLSNLTATGLVGKVKVQLFNALTMQPVKLLVNAAEAEQTAVVDGFTNKAISFKLAIPGGLEALTYRLTAAAGNYSDGEENTIPVLPNRMLVTESMPMMIRAGQTKNYNFEKLTANHSPTLQSKTLTLEYTQNPAWYAVQALPYLMEFPYECSEQIFSRYYANSLASGLISKMPVIKKVFDQWKNANSPELLSNLEKNQELKATLIEETPWLRDATDETDQKKRIALLFDLTKMNNELDLNLDKLQKKQLGDGGFPWFGGDRADRYITQHIIEGIGQLNHLHIASPDSAQLNDISKHALDYLDAGLLSDYNHYFKGGRNVAVGRLLSDIEIHAWYARSFFADRPIGTDLKPVFDDFMKHALSEWKFRSIYEQGMIALFMQRNKRPDITKMIERSLMETARQSETDGMYWAKNSLGYFWYQNPVETQSLMIALFTEAGNNQKAVDDMKIWLLRNKQTNNWKTTKTTAAACYALLMRGSDWLVDQAEPKINIGNQTLQQLKPGLKAEPGSGYLKTTWVDDQIKPEMGKVTVSNPGKTVSWGALYWQYVENLDKITSAQTDLELQRKYFIEKQTDRGPVLTPVDATHQPKTGDLLKVVVYLKAARDFEYVQLKDMRPAGTEPVDALSTYKYQDGLYYCQVTRDVATNFFISYVNKGNYVFEYRLRVAQPGNYSTGISTVQSMYAPEFSAHSEGMRMVIK